MTFREKLNELSKAAFEKAKENDVDAHADLINQHADVFAFMKSNNHLPTDLYIENK